MSDEGSVRRCQKRSSEEVSRGFSEEVSEEGSVRRCQNRVQ